MLYENVIRLCKENNISTFALERATGLGNGSIWKWGNRTKSPNVIAVKKVADYFGVTVDELLSNKKSKGKGSQDMAREEERR